MLFHLQVSRVSKMLADEYGTASNIKSRVIRLSVLGAITSVQHRLKLYTKVPPNGLVVYCGTIVTDEGKEKKVNIDFEPFKPINTSLYLCDNKFHTEALTALLADDNRFGFIGERRRKYTYNEGMCAQLDIFSDGRQWCPVWHIARQHPRCAAQVHSGPA